ncbi:DSD1 family PLP-dependent enzyme [Alteromonas sp. ZYF713]|nr:DSD1 family PLP-dependent enzyme [Alteromonas sp. ZYF713]
MNQTLSVIDTPCLIVNKLAMDKNINRLKTRLNSMAVGFRPHLKTAKSVEVARRVMDSFSGPATVSTLKEAEQFAKAGVVDMTYAVGVEPGKFKRISALREQGVEISVLLDSVAQAKALTHYCEENKKFIPALIEIDCDGHRSGVRPEQHELLCEIGKTLESYTSLLRGVLTHAGASYAESTPDALKKCAKEERDAAVKAANTLKDAGLPCHVVSVGSTPTAHFSEDLTGVTEVRAGVFVFFDLVMAGIGVCRIEDIALSVLTTVIGHQEDKGWILVDAGWMAMSRDRGTSKQAVDQGYGVVCDIYGRPIKDLIMVDANQEHGVIALRSGSTESLPKLPIGSKLRILPNHACATSAQHNEYKVVDGEKTDIVDIWPRFYGW